MHFTERVKQMHVPLEQHAISHAFGGAIALIYAVEHPRLTYDIDINISLLPGVVLGGGPMPREDDV